jgi:hypothetical protein
MIIDPGIFLGEKPQAQSAPILLATVVSIGEHGIILRFDGDVQPGQKHYKCLSSYSPVVGDRVLVAMVGGSGVVLGVAGVESGGSTPPSEWIAVSGTVTYNSVDNPTGVINVPSGHGIEVGNRIKLSNSGNTIYGIVTATTSTTVTFLHEINPANSQALNLLANSAITNVYFSRCKVPSGFPIDPRKWTVKYISTASGSQPSPVAGTWYNIGGSLTVPIGAWRLGYSMQASPFRTTGSTVDQFATLSTASNSESHPEFTTGGGNASPDTQIMLQQRRPITVATKTVFYLNCKTITTMTGTNAIRWLWSVWPIPLIIDAECAYL